MANNNRSFSSGPGNDSGEPGMFEKVVFINRCAKVVKGGRRFSFSALSVVGDGKGKVGIGYGKANEVPDAIKKSTESAKKRMVSVKLKGSTIPHEVLGQYDGGKVFLRPASNGTGLIAGGTVDRLRKPFRGGMFFVQQDNWALPAIETAAAEAFHWAPRVEKYLAG